MAHSATIHPQVQAALRRLDDLAKRKPELADAVAFYRAVIPALHDAQQTIPAFVLDPTLAQRKLASGRPLLIDEDLPLDLEATARFFSHLCRIVENIHSGATGTPQRSRWSLFKPSKPASPAPGEQVATNAAAPSYAGVASSVAAARQIRRATERKQLDLVDVWAAVATADERRLDSLAVELQLEAGLLRVLAENSLRPALRAWAQALNGTVDLSHWRRGRCPLCGNNPVLSEIQGKEGQRRLRCTRCGAGWYYPRLQCAFCGRKGHKTLGYVAVEGEEEKYRLQTCEVCKGYLKVVVTFDPIPLALLPVEDLATLHLDEIAVEQGYTPALAPQTNP